MMALVLGKNEDYRSQIEFAQKLTSIDGSAIAALIDAEAAKIDSGPDKDKWDKDSSNEGSGAAGLTQFLASTWLGHARQPSHLLNARGKEAGLISNSNTVISGKQQALLKLRFNPLLSITSAAEYGIDNLRALTNAGVLPGGISDDQRARYMYLAHHEGPGGAVGFLSGTKTYTRANLITQVGQSTADALIARSGGDASAAYRNWLNHYMDEKIVPSKFRDGAPLVVAGRIAPPPIASADGVPLGSAYVTTEGLNLRKEPGGEIVESLTIGQPITVISRIDETRWYQVEVDGAHGVVSGAYLRAPIEQTKEHLLAKLISEWVRFKKGRSSEEDEPYNSYIHEMWLIVGENWYGNSKYPNGKDVPWSAAFISFVVANAGKEYEEFHFDSSHSVFSNDAIRARVMHEVEKPFWGYRISEKRPEIGDIVHRNRLGSGTVYSYDYAENHAHFESHSDIVCEVRGRIARVIGGNTGGGEGTVAIGEYELDDNGYLAQGQKIIALLKNRSNEI